MRVVVDTNIFVSGIFWKGPPATILEHWYQKKFELLVSSEILEEYSRVMEELETKYPQVTTSSILELVALNATIIKKESMTIPHCDDPDDDKFLLVAASGKAPWIVTGDKALLRVKSYPGGTVVTAKHFLNELR